MSKNYLKEGLPLKIVDLVEIYNYVCPSNSKLLMEDVSLYVLSLQSSIITEILIKKCSKKVYGKYLKTHNLEKLFLNFIHSSTGLIDEAIRVDFIYFKNKYTFNLTIDHSILRYSSVKDLPLPSEQEWDNFFMSLIHLCKSLGID